MPAPDPPPSRIPWRFALFDRDRELDEVGRLALHAHLFAAGAVIALAAVVKYATPWLLLDAALVIVGCLLLLVVAVSKFCLRRGRGLTVVILGQVLADLGLITFLVHFTGGLGSVFSFGYFLVILFAGSTLALEGAYLAATVASFGFALVNLGKYFSFLPLLPLFPVQQLFFDETRFFALAVALHAILFYVTAYFSGRLAALLAGARTELRRERNLTAGILANLDAAVAVLDDELRIVTANRTCTRWYPAAVAGIRFPDALAPHHPPAAVARLTAEFHSGRDFVIEELVRAGDGPRSAGVRATRADGDPGYRWLVVLFDTTAAVTALRRGAESERLAATGRLAAGIAHELNNPLASISSYLQFLASDRESVFGAAKLDPVIAEVHRAGKIIRDLLLLAHRPPAAAAATFDPAPVVRGLAGFLGPEAKRRGIRLDCDCPPSLPPVRGEGDRFKQVLLNLLLNAFDATPLGGTVTLLGFGVKGAPRFEVSDTGAGIAPADLDRVFEPFFTTKPPGQGTGLGLTLARQYAHELGGELTLDSAPGRGTAARLRFPGLGNGTSCSGREIHGRTSVAAGTGCSSAATDTSPSLGIGLGNGTSCSGRDTSPSLGVGLGNGTSCSGLDTRPSLGVALAPESGISYTSRR